MTSREADQFVTFPAFIGRAPTGKHPRGTLASAEWAAWQKVGVVAGTRSIADSKSAGWDVVGCTVSIPGAAEARGDADATSN